jgi:hypothetical protein
MITIDPTKIPPFESKIACLPKPDLFEELALLSRYKVRAEFVVSETSLCITRAMVSLIMPGVPFPVSRFFFLADRDALAAWLRQVRLGIEMAGERRGGNAAV